MGPLFFGWGLGWLSFGVDNFDIMIVMKKILAVSGGIDSMVMLDCAVRQAQKQCLTDELIVAHFDHGIRPESKLDREFVEAQAKERGLKFRYCRAELGEGASEESARKARYDFLYRVADEFAPAEIWTAHHLDDLIESIVINLIRGTGWRGLAVLDTPKIRRPFLEGEWGDKAWSKKDIWRHAGKYRLCFREDSTNNSRDYLRNRVRELLQAAQLDEAKIGQLYILWDEQKRIKKKISDIVLNVLPEKGADWQRDWFKEMDANVATELLRAGLARSNISATRPQIERFRRAILEYDSGKYFNLPQDVLVKLTKDSFVI